MRTHVYDMLIPRTQETIGAPRLILNISNNTQPSLPVCPSNSLLTNAPERHEATADDMEGQTDEHVRETCV